MRKLFPPNLAGHVRQQALVTVILVTGISTSCRRIVTSGEGAAPKAKTVAAIPDDAAGDGKVKSLKGHIQKECRAFRGETGWIETYVNFFIATRVELDSAFPHAGSSSPSEAQTRRAEEVRNNFPELKCLSITEDELDALGDALALPALPKPSPAAIRAANKQAARLLEKLQDTQQKPLLLTDGTETRRYFEPVVVVPEACLAVYELPKAVLLALRDATLLAHLGRKWNSAIIARPLNPMLPTPSTQKPDPRDSVESWQAIVEDLSEFSKGLVAADARLFVEISYDC
jgi:hypothetical protein